MYQYCLIGMFFASVLLVNSLAAETRDSIIVKIENEELLIFDGQKKLFSLVYPEELSRAEFTVAPLVVGQCIVVPRKFTETIEGPKPSYIETYSLSGELINRLPAPETAIFNPKVYEPASKEWGAIIGEFEGGSHSALFVGEGCNLKLRHFKNGASLVPGSYARTKNEFSLRDHSGKTHNFSGMGGGIIWVAESAPELE